MTNLGAAAASAGHATWWATSVPITSHSISRPLVHCAIPLFFWAGRPPYRLSRRPVLDVVESLSHYCVRSDRRETAWEIRAGSNPSRPLAMWDWASLAFEGCTISSLLRMPPPLAGTPGPGRLLPPWQLLPDWRIKLGWRCSTAWRDRAHGTVYRRCWR